MISYQPGLDRFHTLLRMACLLKGLSSCYPVEIDKFRILDFFVAFPFRLEGFTFRQGQTSLKKIGKTYAHTQPYGGVPDDTTLFLRMAPMQALAMDTLAAHEMIDPESYKKDAIKPGSEQLPPEIEKRAAAFCTEHEALLGVLQALAGGYPLLGEDGLKRRSGLMEHKYDAA